MDESQKKVSSSAPRTSTRSKKAASKKPATKRTAAKNASKSAATSTSKSASSKSSNKASNKASATIDRATGNVPATIPKRTIPTVDDDSVIRRGDVDHWGRSERMRSLARTAFDPIYEKYFRVHWDGFEKIPTEGGALLVANHAGAFPPDATIIMHGIEKELERPVYGLADFFFKDLPVVGTMWSRLGGLTAHPDNSYRLLHDEKQLVLVFPEGVKGPAKSFDERYKLRRFGRGGFVETAMRAGVPVIPIAVVGAEEAMPILARMPALSKQLGVPYIPLTMNHLVFGPVIGNVAYFPAKFHLNVLEPVYFNEKPGLKRYSRSRVMEASEKIRGDIQLALHDMIKKRKNPWQG